MSNWMAITVSLGAFFVAAMSYVRSAAAARAQVYLEFRKRFSELKGSIPRWYDAPEVPETATKKELRNAELYWQNAFDEWFVTTRLEPLHLGKLCRRFYRGTLTLGLKNQTLREVAAKLTHGSAEFGEHQEEFRAALNTLCIKAYKVPLCGDESCSKCGSTRRRHARAAV